MLTHTSTKITVAVHENRASKRDTLSTQNPRKRRNSERYRPDEVSRISISLRWSQQLVLKQLAHEQRMTKSQIVGALLDGQLEEVAEVHARLGMYHRITEQLKLLLRVKAMLRQLNAAAIKGDDGGTLQCIQALVEAAQVQLLEMRHEQLERIE